TPVDCGVTKSIECGPSDDSAVSADIGRVEADSGKKFLQCLVAAPKEILPVESAPDLVDDAMGKLVNIGDGQRVVPAIILSEAQSGERAEDGIVRCGLC